MTIVRHEAMAGLWEQAITLAERLAPEDWQRPVPWCPDWNVADLVSHLGGLQSSLNGAPQPEPAAEVPTEEGRSPFDHSVAVNVAARRNWNPPRRIDELRRAADAHVAHLQSVTEWLEEAQGPLGRTTQDGLFRVRTFDVWVHLADLRDAIGEPLDLDDASPGAESAHGYVLGLVPWLFVKRAGAQDGATMRVTLGAPLNHDSVLEVVERRATWNPAGDPGGCSVTGKPAAFTLMVAGRGEPEHWQAQDALAWTGPRGAEFVERARLF